MEVQSLMRMPNALESGSLARFLLGQSVLYKTGDLIAIEFGCLKLHRINVCLLMCRLETE